MTTDDSLQRRRPTVLRRAVWVLLGLAVIAAHVMSAGHASATAAAEATTDSTPAAQTLRTLVGPRPEDTMNYLPTDFENVMGYRPRMSGGYPVNPDGGCSSPIPLPARFEPACRTHDFGYDLLRYAQRTGKPLGPWARPALDHMLVNRMHALCHDPACVTAAELSRAGLAVNTWRQHSGPPAASESTATIVASTAVRMLAELGAGVGVS